MLRGAFCVLEGGECNENIKSEPILPLYPRGDDHRQGDGSAGPAVPPGLPGAAGGQLLHLPFQKSVQSLLYIGTYLYCSYT